jgi:zinc protease
MIVTIVGAVKAEDAFRLWEDAFGDWRSAGLRPFAFAQALLLRPLRVCAPRCRKRRECSMRAASRSASRANPSDLVLGFVGSARAARTTTRRRCATRSSACSGLYGRLGAKVRVKGGMAYSCLQLARRWACPGAWSVIAGVNPANVDRAVDLIRGEIGRMRDTKVPASELADNKARSSPARLPLRSETNDGVADQITNMELYGLGLDYLQNYADMVNAITPQQMRRRRPKVPDRDAYALAVAGPLNSNLNLWFRRRD